MNSSSAGPNDTASGSANATNGDSDDEPFENLTDYVLIVLFCLVILTTVVSGHE